MKSTSGQFSIGINAVQAGGFPAWRQGKPIGQFFEIPNTAYMAGATNAVGATIDTWNGFANSETAFYSALGSGHGEWRNGLHKFDFSADAPQWTTPNAGSVYADVTSSDYYADGLPQGRHTYNSNQFISAAHSRDGVDRVMILGSFAFYGMEYPRTDSYGNLIPGPGVYKYGTLCVDSFNLATNRYDPELTAGAKTWSQMPTSVIGEVRSIAKHPMTEEVYVGTGYSLVKWSPTTDAWSTVQTVPPSPETNAGSGGLLAWDRYSSLVDVSRNRVLALHDGAPYYNVGFIRLQMVDLTSGVISELPITGTYPTQFDQAGFVHDLDNDRYVLITGGKIFAINPVTGATSQSGPVASPVNGGAINRAAYFQTLGGIGYLPSFASNMLFMPTR